MQFIFSLAADIDQDSKIPIYLVPHGAFCDSGPLVAEAFKVDSDVKCIMSCLNGAELCTNTNSF